VINEREVLIYAFRYTLGRSTYATGIMQDVLRSEWNRMSLPDQQLIKREINEAPSLGMEEVDAPGWKAILDWPLKEE